MVLNNYVIAAIKKTAQNNYPLIAKRDKLQKKITDLTAKKEELEKVAQSIAVKAYQQAQENNPNSNGGQSGASGNGSDTVDADFSDVQ